MEFEINMVCVSVVSDFVLLCLNVCLWLVGCSVKCNMIRLIIEVVILSIELIKDVSKFIDFVIYYVVILIIKSSEVIVVVV